MVFVYDEQMIEDSRYSLQSEKRMNIFRSQVFLDFCPRE